MTDAGCLVVDNLWCFHILFTRTMTLSLRFLMLCWSTDIVFCSESKRCRLHWPFNLFNRRCFFLSLKRGLLIRSRHRFPSPLHTFNHSDTADTEQISSILFLCFFHFVNKFWKTFTNENSICIRLYYKKFALLFDCKCKFSSVIAEIFPE